MILIFICLTLAFVGFGLMDELAHHFDNIRIPFIRKNPQFWDKRISWENKYNPVDDGWVTVMEEKFWGSSRWFVFLTDGWHLVQFLSYQLLTLAIALALVDSTWVALLLSLPLHIACSTIKAVTMKVV